ncbi:hypothetical protein [Flagellimonas sp. S3867]|uniref:hypothetical protein n=1 Tax=Flagellimonas sp. S3867 TaxID=2768063 RepID=UPI001686095E|nr:hypothetical protein [Flagellimonas sp. S3867]
MKAKISAGSKSICLAVLSCLVITCKPKADKQVDKVQEEKQELKTIALVGKRGINQHTYVNEIDPFLNSYLTLPEGYTGPSFDLKHDYPVEAPPPADFPWKKVTNDGLITQNNSLAYVNALKEYVSADMHKLIFDYNNWNDKTMPWWQSIWLGTQREPIHGMYVGSEFNAGTLAEQDINLTTFVYTLYDATSAVTLNRIWGADLYGAENPNLSDVDAAQYIEGSVIVKFAFVTASGEEWSPMESAATWTVYTDVDPATGQPTGGEPKMMDLYLMQFDIIVKDSQAAPQTGWVFSTLVYDKNAPGNDAWDKMVPLGATWGDNPDVINLNQSALIPPVTVNPSLSQNWINMNTPDYARSTLGWDGRLSGPNDGAVVAPAITTSKVKYDALATVGCLGCHSSAQYKSKSFLMPAPFPPKQIGDALEVYDPGSQDWMKWFQSNDGKTPMDGGPGQIGLDYDMVTSFKAIPMWEAAMKQKAEATASVQ